MEKETEQDLNLLSGAGMWHTDTCGGKYPALLLSDGPHGLRKQEEKAKTNNDSVVSTCYPTASCLAASWDKELVRKVGESLGEEAYAAEVSVLLGPGVNIKRSPLCGRNFEYFSEDPLLAGELGTAFVKGVQSKGVGTSLKHFAGNSQETCRMTSNSRIDERTLREIYLPAFERVVKEAEPSTIMASYNYLNGYHSTENRHLLTDILRKEWGYDGVVVSDWGACMDLRKAVPAGMDLEMPNSLGIHVKQLRKALKTGEVKEENVKPALKRLRKLIKTYGVEYREEKVNSKINHKENGGLEPHRVALEASIGGAVLLKNEGGVLPLNVNEDREIIVVGALAENMRFQGGGSSHINTANFPNALQALSNKGYVVRYVPGYRLETDKTDEELKNNAVEAVKELIKLRKDKAIPILFFGGLTDISEGEGYDRTTLSAPENQMELLEAICRETGKVIFVSFGGAPYELPRDEYTSAILHMYLGGEAVGEAIAELVSGDANPSGRLAETFPLRLQDTPAYGNFAFDTGNEIHYTEGVLVGYRHYDTNNIPVRYGFGYGLSYTTFSRELVSVEPEAGNKNTYKVSVRVTNTGNCKGQEVVQIYVENPESPYYKRARHELAAFEKVELLPGESKEITLIIPERCFSVFDAESGRFEVVKGQYRICTGYNAEDSEKGVLIDVEGKDYGNEANCIGLKGDIFVGARETNLDSFEPGDYSIYNSLTELSKDSRLARGLLRFLIWAAYLLYPGKPKDDPEVMMTIEGIKTGPIDCVICQAGGIIPYFLVSKIVKQANKRRK